MQSVISLQLIISPIMNTLIKTRNINSFPLCIPPYWAKGTAGSKCLLNPHKKEVEDKLEK